MFTLQVCLHHCFFHDGDVYDKDMEILILEKVPYRPVEK